MADGIFLLAAGAAALLSFCWLALAMQVHWEQVHGTGAPSRISRTALRTLGAFGLIGCGALCFVADRPSMALLLWVMLMAFGATAVAFTLAWKPSLLRLVWPGAANSAGADCKQAG